MKKYTSLVLLSLLLLFVFGCYESEIPLSEPTLKINPKLLNYWTGTFEAAGDTRLSKIGIFQFNEKEYLIFGTSKTIKTMDPSCEGYTNSFLFRGFVTEIGDMKIMNLQNLCEDRTYIFFKYNITDNGTLRIQMLSGGAIDSPLYDNKLKTDKKFNTPEEFRNFIEENIKNKNLFCDVVEFKPAEEFDFTVKTE